MWFIWSQFDFIIDWVTNEASLYLIIMLINYLSTKNPYVIINMSKYLHITNATKLSHLAILVRLKSPAVLVLSNDMLRCAFQYPFYVFDSNSPYFLWNAFFPKFSSNILPFLESFHSTIWQKWETSANNLRKGTEIDDGSRLILCKFMQPTTRAYGFNEKIRRNHFSLRPVCFVGKALGQETQFSGLLDYHPDYSFTVKVNRKEAYGLGSDAFA